MTLVQGPTVRLDRESTVRALLELIEEVQSGYCAAFEIHLDVDGVGGIRKVTVEERHPMAPSFDVGEDNRHLTPPTSPGARGKK